MPERPPRDSLLTLIWQSPICRNGFISLIFFGFGVSCTVPFLTLFLVEELSVSLSHASLFYFTGIATPISGILVGRYSDTRPDRVPLIRLCCVLQMVGWAIVALATSFIVPIVANVLLLGLGAAANPLLFAAVRDDILRRQLPRQGQILSTVRLSYVAAWAIGPVLGSWISDQFGLRALFWFASASFAVSILPLLRVSVPRFVTVVALSADTPIRARSAMMPLLCFSFLATLAMSGTSLKFSFIPVYAEDELRISATMLGLIIGIQPLFEVPLFMLAAAASERFGALAVLITGMGFGMASHLVFATADGALALFAGQILGAAMHAAIIGVGIVVAQGLYPQGLGVASSLYYGTLGLGGTVAGVIGAIAVGPLGLPHLFYLPATLCAVVLVGILLLAPSIRRAQHAFSH